MIKKNDKKKRKLIIKLEELPFSDFDGLSPSEVSDMMLKLDHEYNKFDTLYFDVDTDNFEYGESFPVINLYGKRDETDEEYQKRLREEEGIKERKKEKRRMEYEKLKKEFEES
jgi:hypothetical protein